MNKCRYCGKEIPELSRNNHPMKFCGRKCSAAYQCFCSGQKTLGSATCGFGESNNRKINRRRREVYERMRKFSRLDGMRSR